MKQTLVLNFARLLIKITRNMLFVWFLYFRNVTYLYSGCNTFIFNWVWLWNFQLYIRIWLLFRFKSSFWLLMFDFLFYRTQKILFFTYCRFCLHLYLNIFQLLVAWCIFLVAFISYNFRLLWISLSLRPRHSFAFPFLWVRKTYILRF